jgi:hypothetical protein
MSLDLLEKLVVANLLKKFIAMFTRFHILSQMNSIHDFPFYLYKIHFNIILLVTPTSVFFQVLSLKLYMIVSPIVFCLIILKIYVVEYKLWSSSLCNFLSFLHISSHCGTNILLRTLFLNPSLNVTNQVPQTHYPADSIIVLYILIFVLLDSRREDKRFWTDWRQALTEFNLEKLSVCYS